MTRFLRPSVLALLPSGLWAVDAFHPVAAVLDPETGALRRVVSWAQVPPPPPKPRSALTRLPTVRTDGTGLWVHRDEDGPLVRLDEDGVGAAVWTDGLELSTCGPGVAWCELVPFWPPREQDRPWRENGRLLRVDRDGRTTPVHTRGRIERIKAGPRALFVELAVPPTAGTGSGMTPPNDWVGLPWDADVPDLLVPPRGLRSPRWDPEVPGERVAGGPGVPEADEPGWDSPEELPWDGVGKDARFWYSEPSYAGAVATDRHRWGLGWNQEWPRPAPDRRRILATAQNPEGAGVRRWELGAGRALSALPLGDRLAVSVARAGGAGEVLALDPATDEVTVLLAADTVDITELGWPVVPRPVEADSYVAQVSAESSEVNLAQDGGFDLRAAPVGAWPDTQLEWTFRLTQRPGLVLRRRVPLFDELGRISYPELAITYLVETVGGGGVPSAEDAVDGILDL